MERYKFIAGFSDIKSEFRAKTGTTKEMHELRLWFSVEDGVLYAHDFFDHKKSIVLAVLESSTGIWKTFLRQRSYGERLVKDIVENSLIDIIADEFQQRYKLYGF